MSDKIKMGLIGLGCRGYMLLEDVFLFHPDVEFTMICDSYEDRCKEAADKIEEMTGKRPECTTDAYELIHSENVESVIISSAWETHIKFSIEAMKAGKAVACEVGGAYSLQDCWRLVETYEETKTPIMLLENCCYGREEMMVMNMVKQGIFGEIVHCEGGYMHDLRDEVGFGKEERHYRLRNYIHRNTENYPTHELGPIAQVLNINRGNRMMTLTAMASKAAGMKAYLKTAKPGDTELQNTTFNQGDVITTTIKCANGETICLTLDTTLPRYYSRGFMIHGTKAMYNEENESLFIEGEEHAKDHFEWKKQWGNIEQYREKYEHPTWKSYLEEGVKKGHGGMDWLVFSDFVDALKNNKEMPIDVYDMAAWMCITTLAEDSIALGGHPVAVPDFTNGAWMMR